jgi:SAM-dependent methyltransferase
MASDPTLTVQQQFGAVASAYVVSPVHARGPDLPKLVVAAGCSGGERVLDLGTAAGHTALALAPRVAEVIGIDVTAEMVELARGLAYERGVPNAEFKVADVAELPFDDRTFDIVTSRYSAHHYPRPQRAFAEAFRVLRPGGRLMLVDTVAPDDPVLDTFVNCIELLRDRSHVRDKSVYEWTSMVTGLGFAVELLEEWFLDQRGADWVARMRTPEQAVAMIRTLMREAPAPAKEAFALNDEEPWSFRLWSAMLRAVRPAP